MVSCRFSLKPIHWDIVWHCLWLPASDGLSWTATWRVSMFARLTIYTAGTQSTEPTRAHNWPFPPLFAMFRNVQGFHHRFYWVYFSTNGAHMKPSGGFLQHDPVAARSGAGCGCILPGGSGPVLQLLGISSWGYHGSWWIQKWQVMYACSLLFRSCIVINYG